MVCCYVLLHMINNYYLSYILVLGKLNIVHYIKIEGRWICDCIIYLFPTNTLYTCTKELYMWKGRLQERKGVGI
jgi:hypothetical protein